MTSEHAGPGDPVEQIFAALAQIRGRRRPHGPEDAAAHRGGRGFGPMRGYGHGHPHAGDHPMPPWAAGGRLAGPARMRMLDAVMTASRPLTVSEVGDAIGVDQPRASRLIQQNVELGFVRREADPDDARRTRVALTEAGTALVRGFRGQRREQLSEALAGFDADERAELARLLGKLAAAWPQR